MPLAPSQVLVELISIRFRQLTDLWKVTAGFEAGQSLLLVLFTAAWDRSHFREERLAKWFASQRSFASAGESLQIPAIAVFKLLVNGGDEAENYVVDALRVRELPHLAIYNNGGILLHAMDKLQLQRLEAFSSLIPFPLQIKVLSSSAWKTLAPPSNILATLFERGDNLHDEEEDSPLRLFVAGSRSTAGKSSICLGILKALIERYGVSPAQLSYIKPATQCEAEQPITRYCRRVGIRCNSIGPVVFYKGFTRAFLAGETTSSATLLAQIREAVHQTGQGSRLQLVDGVGYPAVGAICGVCNGKVASTLDAPAVVIGRPGVGDAVDSYCLDAAYLRSCGVRVLGPLFNRLAREGFYGLEACRAPVEQFFRLTMPDERPYGFLPLIEEEGEGRESTVDRDMLREERFQDRLAAAVEDHVDLRRLIFDVWRDQVRRLCKINHTNA